MSAPAPVSPDQRVALLDALRGFALFGILLVNLAEFSGYFLLSDAERATRVTATVDQGLFFAIGVLFHGKFYTIFSLLFGIGVALQLRRNAPIGRFVRRYLWLFVFGIVHMLLIWPGDILAPYAVAGLLLLAFRGLPDRWLLISGVILVLAPVAMHALYVALNLDPRAAVMSVVNGVMADAPAGGGGRVLADHAMNPLRRFANLLGESRMFKILGVFAIGLWIGRRGIFRDPDAHRPLLRRVMWLGLAAGIPGSIAFEHLSADAYFPASELGLTQSAWYAIGVVPLGLAWAATFALAWTTPAWQKLLAAFAPAGRMALSNYLAQSVICAPIFLLAVNGITPTMGPSLWLPLAIVIFSVQVWLSRRWLAKHERGPMEALWRRLTYTR